MRTVITGPADGVGRGEDAAAAVLNGFDGVRLGAEAEAAITAALEACAARARAADAAYDKGGYQAREAEEDDPAVPFLRVPDGAAEYRGELEFAVQLEEFVPFSEDEPDRRQAGAEKSAALLALETEMAERRAREALPKLEEALPPPTDEAAPAPPSRRAAAVRKGER